MLVTNIRQTNPYSELNVRTDKGGVIFQGDPGALGKLKRVLESMQNGTDGSALSKNEMVMKWKNTNRIDLTIGDERITVHASRALERALYEALTAYNATGRPSNASPVAVLNSAGVQEPLRRFDWCNTPAATPMAVPVANAGGQQPLTRYDWFDDKRSKPRVATNATAGAGKQVPLAVFDW